MCESCCVFELSPESSLRRHRRVNCSVPPKSIESPGSQSLDPSGLFDEKHSMLFPDFCRSAPKYHLFYFYLTTLYLHKGVGNVHFHFKVIAVHGFLRGDSTPCGLSASIRGMRTDSKQCDVHNHTLSTISKKLSLYDIFFSGFRGSDRRGSIPELQSPTDVSA